MSTLSIVNAMEFERLLFQLGFLVKRQNGSHKFYKHSDGRFTTIPHQSNEDLSRPLIRAILNQIDLSLDDFIELLNN